MRCPKCGYISFDHLETCTKCRKNIAEASKKLAGTIYKAETPAFLQFEIHQSETDKDISNDLLPKDEGADVELLLEEDALVSDETQIEEDLDLDFMDESVDALDLDSSQDDEFDIALSDDDSIGLDLDTEGKDATEGADGPQLDFSELDISDLVPPSADEDNLSSGELTFDDVAGSSSTTAVDAAQPSMKESGTVLEDLHMDGLDLEIPSVPPAGSATGKKLKPSVKTGTALDEFDIDLGELIFEQER
jgi:hypothetical protein